MKVKFLSILECIEFLNVASKLKINTVVASCNRSKNESNKYIGNAFCGKLQP